MNSSAVLPPTQPTCSIKPSLAGTAVSPTPVNDGAACADVHKVIKPNAVKLLQPNSAIELSNSSKLFAAAAKRAIPFLVLSILNSTSQGISM